MIEGSSLLRVLRQHWITFYEFLKVPNVPDYDMGLWEYLIPGGSKEECHNHFDGRKIFCTLHSQSPDHSLRWFDTILLLTISRFSPSPFPTDNF